jgi:hypothetical protein
VSRGWSYEWCHIHGKNPLSGVGNGNAPNRGPEGSSTHNDSHEITVDDDE